MGHENVEARASVKSTPSPIRNRPIVRCIETCPLYKQIHEPGQRVTFSQAMQIGWCSYYSEIENRGKRQTTITGRSCLHPEYRTQILDR